MRRSRFTDSQILAVLRQGDGGTAMPGPCRQQWIGSAAFYKWRSKFGGMDVSLMTRMKELEEENRRLKKFYIEAQKIKADILAEALANTCKAISPARGGQMDSRGERSEHSSGCEAFGLRESGYRYQPKLHTENVKIADWLLRLTENQYNWGFGLCLLYLRNVKDFRYHHNGCIGTMGNWS